MSELAAIFCAALVFGALGWVLLAVVLVRQRELRALAATLEARVIQQGEQIGRLRQDLQEKTELAEYRARLIQRLPVVPQGGAR